MLPFYKIKNQNVKIFLVSYTTYAIAAKDPDGNFFLFRRKPENDFVLWGKDGLMTFVSNLLTNTGKDRNKFIFNTKEISRKLYEKIRRWTSVEKKDVEPLFDSDIIVPDEDEVFLLKEIRKKKIPIAALLKYIGRFKSLIL